MTKPRYLAGCVAGSQVPGIAVGAGYGRVVNLNNGNVNINHENNRYSARAVLAGECQHAVTFAALYSAWRAARHGKKPSQEQVEFDLHWADNLLGLLQRLKSGTWHPSAPTCFIENNGKAREIHAPAFADRVVHHWIEPHLQTIYEPTFIEDCYSNRRGKGTHVAVRRLQQFVRQVASGQGGGYYLQLDIKNYFNSIHRPTLYRMLKLRMERAGTSQSIRRVVHALLNYPISRTGVRMQCTAAERAIVPAYKRLENAAPGCGIAIGNLSSQSFANVYLDPLDQFVKHILKARRYLRYVDDFVLIHHSREQLEAWRTQIEQFLRQELRLELKAEQKLRPLRDGIDFLGYIVRPTHTIVRRRVIAHCRTKLAAFERRDDWSERAKERLRSVWASYQGHFRHAQHFRLMTRTLRRFPWLSETIKARR